jgi:CRP-like cAMP-binding protein
MIFVIFIWIYCSFLIIIFGAELIVNAGKKDALILKGLFLENSRQSFRTLMNKFITTYQEGDIIFREGKSGDNMFYILNGSVSRKGQTISIIEKGGYFGEMSMLLNTHRTATAIVMESDTQLVSISQNNFDVILSENPNIVLSILKEMTSRLKKTDDNV